MQLDSTIVNSGGSPIEPAVAIPVTHIKPTSGWSLPPLRELWDYRDLLYFFIWRDIKVRYKQTVLGASWAIIQPFFTMVVFTIFFGNLAKVNSYGLPYPIFSYTALVPWTFFANGMRAGAESLVANSNMVKKIYFPRLILPVSAVLSGFVDFILAFAVLIVMMFYYEFALTITALWIIPLLFLAIMTSLGASLWLSAMNVQFRDVRYVVPFLVQLWLFITPIIYSSNELSEPWRTIYGVNPMAGVIEGFRWALLSTDTAPGPIMAVSTTVSTLLLISGIFYFRKMEKTFADVT